jgi:2-polyprenyl-3-methyl-5-hydroxy-6-metoxy-1,4-benzoquinol methylase/glycosyltransferase involved in cell wall biosynthesis
MSDSIDHLGRPLLPDVGVIAMVPDTWNTWWQPRHYVLSRLAQYFHVVWVTPAHDWREMLRGWRNGSSDSADSFRPPGLVVYEPEPWLPKIYRPKWLERFTFDARLKRARRLLTSRGCRKIILYLWRPEFAPALSSTPFDLSCYHIDDEYSFSEVELPPDPAETALIAKVNQVFIHSPRLLERKGGINPNTEFIPNGVDFQAYTKAAPEPPDLAGIPHPRIGYSGYIKKQLDWPLIFDLTERHPDWSFVFVGPLSSQPRILPVIQELSRHPNVYFLGGKSLPDLAAYPQYFDVCIMPYRVDGYTDQIFPLKMHEYLASGQPVVSSPIRSLRDFSSVITLATTPDEWSCALANALEGASRCPDAVASRRKIAAVYDWGRLIYSLARTVCERLGPEESDRFAKLVSDNGTGGSNEALSFARKFTSSFPHSHLGGNEVNHDTNRAIGMGLRAAAIKNKIGSFLSDPHFPFFLLVPIQRISPTLARFLKYGRYNPNTEKYWNKRYEAGEYETSEAERYRDLRREVARLVPQSSRVLEIGCGTGTLMEILRDQLRCSCVGVDISAVAVDIVRQKGFPAFKSQVPNLPVELEESSFDVCTIVETLEHISSPANTLRNVSRFLKERSGSIIVCVPDDCMKPEEFDEHVSAFTAHSLREMMSRDYEIEESMTVESGGHRYLIVKGKRL